MSLRARTLSTRLCGLATSARRSFPWRRWRRDFAGLRVCGDGLDPRHGRIGYGLASRKLRATWRNSLASGQALANAMRIRVVVSMTRAATLISRRRMVANSAALSAVDCGSAWRSRHRSGLSATHPFSARIRHSSERQLPVLRVRPDAHVLTPMQFVLGANQRTEMMSKKPNTQNINGLSDRPQVIYSLHGQVEQSCATRLRNNCSKRPS